MQYLNTLDMIGRRIVVPTMPQRIISVVPSITELLFDLGIGDRVIACTKFCVHPKEKTSSLPKIGGTKNLDLPRIISLKPQLIIANKEENERLQIEELANHIPVWTSEITDIDAALRMIDSLGSLLDCSHSAKKLIGQIQEQRTKLGQLVPPVKALYFIWRKPYMLAGNDTYIHHMMEAAGYTNLLTESRYPSKSVEELVQYCPEEVLLSSEPYPFKARHIEELQVVFPDATIRLVDGEFFSWYGSRMSQAFDYFRALKDR
jgi:ABC-type Fe3+-hydroxamate transport system substrate-binding protein